MHNSFWALSPLARLFAVGGLPTVVVASYFNRTKLFPKKSRVPEDPNLLLDRLTVVNGSGWRANGIIAAIAARAFCLAFLAIAWFSLFDPSGARIPLPWPYWGFYTIHTFALTTIYFLVAFTYSFKRFCSGGHQVTNPAEASLLRFIHTLYQYLLAANVLVTIGYWTVTRMTMKPVDRIHYDPTWQCLIHHVMNTIFMFIEFYINESSVDPVNWDLTAFGSVIYYTFCILVFGILPSLALDLRDTRSLSVVVLLLVSVVGYYFLWCMADHIRGVLPREKEVLPRNMPAINP